MKSEGKLSDRSSQQQLNLRQKQTLPSEEPFPPPNRDRSLERKSREVRRERPAEQGIGLAGSRANSPGRVPVVVTSVQKESLRLPDSLQFVQKTPIREPVSATTITTQFKPAFTERRAASPPRLTPFSENDLSRRAVQQIIINPPPLVQTQVIQLPQPIITSQNITVPQVVTTQSVNVPAGNMPQLGPGQQFLASQQGSVQQQSMVVNNSRNTEQLLNQKDQVLRRFKQTIDQKEGRLRNYQHHITSLQQKLEEQDLQKRANIIMTSFITEISGYFSSEELTLDQLRQHILQLIANGKKASSMDGIPVDHHKKTELAAQLQRVMILYKELETKQNKTELSLFESTRDNNTKTRQIQQLRTKVLQLQSASSSTNSLMGHSRMEFELEMRNLKSLNFSLERELEFLKGKLGLANLPTKGLSSKETAAMMTASEGTGSQVSSPLENEWLRARILALEIQLQGRNQEIQILSHKIRSYQDDRQGIPTKSNDSLSYSIEGYDREQRLSDMNQSNVRKIKQEDNASSALRLISMLQVRSDDQQQPYGNPYYSAVDRGQEYDAYNQNENILHQEAGREPKKSGFSLPTALNGGLQVVPEMRSHIRSDVSSPHNSELDRHQTSLLTNLNTVNQQLRQRIVELENENIYTKERLSAQLTKGDKEEMVRRNEQLKDQKLKLQLKIIGLQKQNAEIESKVREMWDMHKRQIEGERQKNRLSFDNFKHKEMILKARIQELQGVVKLEYEQKGVNAESEIEYEPSRYDRMEEQLRSMHEYRIKAVELQAQLNEVTDQNEQLRKEIVTRDSELNIFRQQLDGLSMAKRLLEQQLGVPSQSKSRSSSMGPSPKEMNEMITFIQSHLRPGAVEIGVQADFPSDDQVLLGEYREQLECLNERMNLLTVQNNRLKSSEQGLKIDTETLKRHLQQTGGQMDMLIKELDQARQRNDNVLHLQLQLQEHKNRLQTYKLNERSFVSGSAEEVKGQISSEPRHRSMQDPQQLQHLQNDMNLLTEQLMQAQKELSAKRNLQQRLRAQHNSELQRVQQDLKIYKQSAQGAMGLCDENEKLKRELDSYKKQQKQADLTQFTQYQGQQREVISELSLKLQQQIVANRRLEQQISLLNQQLKSAEQSMVVLKEAQNVFKGAQQNLANQNSSVTRTYEQQIRAINRQLQSTKQEIVQLRQAESQYHMNVQQLEQIGRQNSDKLTRTLQEQQVKFTQKEQQLSNAKNSLDISDRNRKELSVHLQKMVGELQKSRSTEQAYRRKLQEQNRLYSQLNNEKIQEAEKYIRDINQERSSRIEAVKQVQEGLYQQQAQKMMKLQQQMTGQLTQLRKQNHTLSSQLVTVQAAREELRSKLTNSEEQAKRVVADMKHSLDEYASINQQLQASIRQLSSNNAALQSENVETLGALQQTEESLTQTIRSLERQLGQSKQQLQQREQDFKRNEQTSKVVRQQTEERNNLIIQELERNAAQIKSDYSRKDQQLKKAQEDLRRIAREAEVDKSKEIARITQILTAQKEREKTEVQQLAAQSFRQQLEVTIRNFEQAKLEELTHIRNQRQQLERTFQEQQQRLIGRITELELQWEQQRAANAQLVEESNFRNQQFIEGRSAIQRLESMFREIEQTHLIKISELQNYTEELRKGEGTSDQRIQQLEYELNEKGRQLSSLQTTEQQHLTRIGDMEGTIERLQRTIHIEGEQFRQSFHAIEQECNILKRENTGLLQKLQGREQGRDRQGRLQQSISELEGALAQARREVSHSKARESSHLEHISQVEESLRQLTATHAQHRQQIGEMTSNIEFLNSAVRDLNSEIEAKARRIRQLQTYAGSHVSESQQLKFLSERSKSLQEVNRHLQQQNHSVQSSNQQLTMQLAELTQQCEYLAAEKDKLESVISTLASQLKSSAKLIESAKALPRTSKNDEEILKLRLAQLTKQFQYIHEDRQHLLQEVQQLKANRHQEHMLVVKSSTSIGQSVEPELRKQIAELNLQCQRLYGDKANLEQQVYRLTQNFAQYHSSKAETETGQLTNSSVMQTDMRRRVDELQRQLRIAKRDYQTVLVRIQTEVRNNEALHLQVRQTTTECQRLSAEKHHLEAQVQQFSLSIKSSRNAAASTSSLVFAGQPSIGDSASVQQSLSELTRVCESLASDKARLQQNIIQLNNHLHHQLTHSRRSTASVGLSTSLHQIAMDEHAEENNRLMAINEALQGRIEQLKDYIEQNTKAGQNNKQIAELAGRCESLEIQLEGMLNQLLMVVDGGNGKQIRSSKSFGVGNSMSSLPSVRSIGVSSQSIQPPELFTQLVQQCEQLVRDKQHLQKAATELKHQPTTGLQVQTLSLQLSQLRNQCQFLSKQRVQLQSRLDQIIHEKEEAVRSKQQLESRIREQLVQDDRTAQPRSTISQAISSTALIKTMVEQNMGEMNDRLQRQLAEVEGHCNQLANDKRKLEERIVQISEQPVFGRSATSIVTNGDPRFSMQMQLNDLSRQCETHNREKIELQKRVSELTNELRQVTASSRSNAHTNIELETDAKLLKEEVGRLHELVRMRTTQINGAAQQQHQSSSELRLVQRQLASAEQALKAKDAELTDVKFRLDALNREYLSTKQLMEGLKARSVDIGDSLQRQIEAEGSLSNYNEAERMLMAGQQFRTHRRISSNLAEQKEKYEKELLKLTELNNQLQTQIGFITTEKESIRREAEVRYQQCNSLRLNLQHQQMINSQLADELKEYIKPAGLLQQQMTQHHRYSLPESIKESKSESAVSDKHMTQSAQTQDELKRVRTELEEEQGANSKLKTEVSMMHSQIRQLRDRNSQLEALVSRLKRDIDHLNTQLQKRNYDSTEYSLQQSIRTLKNNVTDRERQLDELKKEYSYLKLMSDSERDTLLEQLKAIKRISYDLQRNNTELTQRNSQLESRLRITQTDSINIRQDHPASVYEDKTSRSEHFKKQMDSILQEMQLKRPESVHGTERRSSRSNEPIPVLRDDTPQPKKPRILRNKSPEVNEEYFNTSGKFQNPFDDFKEIEKPALPPQTIVNQRAPGNINTFSFMRISDPPGKPFVETEQPQTRLIPVSHAPSKNTSATNVQQMYQNPPIPTSSTSILQQQQSDRRLTVTKMDESLNTQRKEQLPPAPLNQFNSRPSMPRPEDENIGKKPTSNSQGNVNFIRITQLSRSRTDQPLGTQQQVLAAGSPRSSQGPAQFIKKSVILSRNEQIVPANDPARGGSRLSISGQSVRSSKGSPEIEVPYFGVPPPPAQIVRTPSLGQQGSRVKTIKMEPLKSSRASQVILQTPSSQQSPGFQTPTHNQSPVFQTPNHQQHSQQTNSQRSELLKNTPQQDTVRPAHQTLIQQSLQQQTHALGTITSIMQEFKPATQGPSSTQQEPTSEASQVDYTVSSSSRRTSQSSLPGMAVFQQHFTTPPADCCGRP